jgi:hypothetical protein
MVPVWYLQQYIVNGTVYVKYCSVLQMVSGVVGGTLRYE